MNARIDAFVAAGLQTRTTNAGAVIARQGGRFQTLVVVSSERRDWNRLLVQRKKHSLLAGASKGANQKKRELAQQDPDLLKPAFMKLAAVPRYYNKKVLIKKRNENGEEVYDDFLNEALFKELGTFGEIVAKSRKELLEGYVCPEGKTPFQLDPELDSLAALPAGLP